MTKFIETVGKTEEAAIAAALEKLGLAREQVSVEIITRPKTGFLGIGRVDAKVRVSYEAPEPVKAEPVVRPQQVQEPKPQVKQAPVKAETPVEKPEEKPVEPPRAQPEEKPVKAKKPAKAKTPKAPKKPEPEQAKQPEAMPETKPEAVDRSGEIQSFMAGLMEHLEVEANPVVSVKAEGIYQVVLEGEDLGALIGRRGETLDAIQQITNYAINHGQRSRVRVHVDCENYRAKREDSLQRLARKTAGKAVKYRRNMMLEPMNAYERHVIHAELQDYHPNISTYSTGTDPNRRIVVAYNK